MRIKDVLINLASSNELYIIRVDEENRIKSYFKEGKINPPPKKEDLTSEGIGTLEGKIRKGETVKAFDKESKEIRIPRKILWMIETKGFYHLLEGKVAGIYTFSEKWITGGYKDE